MGLWDEDDPPKYRPRGPVVLLPSPKTQESSPNTQAETAFVAQMPETVVEKKSPLAEPQFDKSLSGQLTRLFDYLFRKSWFGWMCIAVSFLGFKWVFGIQPVLHSTFWRYFLASFAFAVWGLGWGAWVKYGHPENRKEYKYYGHNNVLGIVLMLLGGVVLYAPEFLSNGEIVVLPVGIILLGLFIQTMLFFVPSFDEAGPAFMREMYVAGLILLAGLMRVIGPGWW